MSKRLEVKGITSCGKCPAYYNFNTDAGETWYICNMFGHLEEDGKFDPEKISPLCPLPEDGA